MAIFSSPTIEGCRPLVAIPLHDKSFGIVPEKVLECVSNKVLIEDGDLMESGTCDSDNADAIGVQSGGDWSRWRRHYVHDVIIKQGVLPN